MITTQYSNFMRNKELGRSFNGWRRHSSLIFCSFILYSIHTSTFDPHYTSIYTSDYKDQNWSGEKHTPEMVSSKHRFLSWCEVKTWTLWPWDASSTAASTISLSAPPTHHIHNHNDLSPKTTSSQPSIIIGRRKPIRGRRRRNYLYPDRDE